LFPEPEAGLAFDDPDSTQVRAPARILRDIDIASRPYRSSVSVRFEAVKSNPPTSAPGPGAATVPRAPVKCDPVWCAGSTMRLTAACKRRGFSWESYHDALPGCVGSGLHQVPRIQGLPRQGDHRRLQKRRTAASGLKEEAVNAGRSLLPVAPTFAMSAYRKSSPPA
jgi:hypothetical protein